MKKILMSAALGASAMLLSACDDTADEADTVSAETDTADTTAADAAPAPTATVTTAAADWSAGTRIVEENGTFYRVDPAGTRVVIAPGTWRIETVDGVRYRVDEAGTRIRIDERGVDVDLDLEPDS